MLKYKVVVSEQAMYDLQNIDSYIANLKGSNINLPSEDILNACDILEQFPFQKSFIIDDADLNNMQFKMLTHNQYIVLFRILDNNIVYIYHVVNSRQDYEQILKKYSP